MLQNHNSTTTVGSIYLNSTGTLTLKNGSTRIGSASAMLSAGTLYRVGIRQSSGSGTGVLEAYLGTGDTAFGTALASSTSEICIGTTNSSAVDATLDDIRLDSAAMPGPTVAAARRAPPPRRR